MKIVKYIYSTTPQSPPCEGGDILLITQGINRKEKEYEGKRIRLRYL